MEKRCPRCETVKPIEEFNRHKSRYDGRAPYCAVCTREIWQAKGKGYARNRGKPYRPKRYVNTVLYDLIFCPEDSWGYESAFTKVEIVEGLRHDCFYPGTRFRRGKFKYVVDENMRLVRV